MLTATAVQNADILRALASEQITTRTQLAKQLGGPRADLSNLGKALKRLEEEGLLAWPNVTEQGRLCLKAFDVAEGKVDADVAADGFAPEGFTTLQHHMIRIGELNPRKSFDDAALGELADDILARGLNQNLLVRPWVGDDHAPGERFELVAGERRWRAIDLLIKRGDLDPAWPIPVKVEDLDDKAHALAALLENLQRVDLSPLEEAAAFEQLVNMNGWTTAQVAEKVSKTQRFVQLRLQLLKLTDDQKARLEKGEMTVKDAWRALANRPEEVAVTPIQVLALALIWTNAYPDPEAHSSYWRKGECHMEAVDQPMIAALMTAGLVESEDPTSWEPKHRIGLSYRGFLALEQQAKELTRAETEDDRQGAMMSIDNAAYAADKAASTEAMSLKRWLGKPMINSPIVQKLIDEKNASDRAREEHERQRQAEKAAAREAQDREQAEGHALLSAIRVFESQAPNMSREEFAAAFAELMERRGYTGPFQIALRSPGDDAWGHPKAPELVMIDGQGKTLAGAGSQFEATRRLQVIAFNHAIGSAVVYSGDELEEEDEQSDDDRDPDNEVEFLDIVTAQFEARGIAAERALELTHRAYQRVVDDVGEFGSEEGEWTRLDAKMVADGWLDDFPETAELVAEDA